MMIIVVHAGIMLPLTHTGPRCMVTNTVGDAETIKLDIKFPPLPNQSPGEGYYISWRNTETEEI